MNDTIEQIILRHGKRGMEVLAAELPENYCTLAAARILSLPRGTVLLTTGFCVSGHAETDGPAGTWAVAAAMKRLGFRPVIVTDAKCEGFFDTTGIETVYLPFDADEETCRALLRAYAPVLLFSLERCGRSAAGEYRTMRGKDIGALTAPCDTLFLLAQGEIPTMGVGDGGNEIGMGRLHDVISEKLSITPCAVPADDLIVATVSNWGGYGLCAALSEQTGEQLLPSCAQIRAYLDYICTLGSVDGVNERCEPTEDGFAPEITEEILSALHGHMETHGKTALG